MSDSQPPVSSQSPEPHDGDANGAHEDAAAYAAPESAPTPDERDTAILDTSGYPVVTQSEPAQPAYDPAAYDQAAYSRRTRSRPIPIKLPRASRHTATARSPLLQYLGW